MRAVQFWILVPILWCMCNGRTVSVADDMSMDTLVDLLLQEEWDKILEFEPIKLDDKGEMILVDGEWRCGDCAGAGRLLYTETTELHVDDGADAPLEFQVGVSLSERTRCVRVRGAAQLRVALLSGGCASEPAAATLGLRAPPAAEAAGAGAGGGYTVTISAYGD